MWSDCAPRCNGSRTICWACAGLHLAKSLHWCRMRKPKTPPPQPEEVPYDIKLYGLERAYHLGDRSAADKVAILCDENGTKLPPWALSEFAHRARINLGIKQKPRGRGSSPHNRDRYFRSHVFAAVLAAMPDYYRGDKKFRIASKLLELEGIHRHWTSVK